MVKAYLRYSPDTAIGVVSSRECNVAADPRGKLVLAGCVESVTVWNVRRGAELRVLKLPKSTEKVTQLCTKGGQDQDQDHVCAVGYADGTTRLWDYESGNVLQTFSGHRSAISCLQFDSSGHLLATGSKDTDIVIWDIVAEAGCARLRGHVDQVSAVLFWNPGTAGTAGTRETLAALGDQKLISASKDRFVRIWSLALQLCVQILAEHQTEVRSLALNGAHTRLAAGSADKFLRLWALGDEDALGGEGEGAFSPGGEGAALDGAAKRPPATFLGAIPRPKGQGSAAGLQFVRPRRLDFEVLLCQGSERTLEVFRCHDAVQVKRRQKRRRRRVQAKVEKRGGATASKGEAAVPAEVQQQPLRAPAEAADPLEKDEGARAADELTELLVHRCSAKIVSMACSAVSGSVVFGLSNNSLESVKIGPGDEPDSLAVAEVQLLATPGHRTAVRALAVSHDDAMVMSASAEAVKVWRASTGRCVRTMAAGYGLCGFFVVGNEHVVLGTKEGRVELFDLRTAELSQSLAVHEGPVYGMSENPAHDGFVSCSADKTIRFFSFQFTTGGGSDSVALAEVRERAAELADECLAVAYSPDGKWIIVALLNHTISMLFADSLKFYMSLYGHRLPVMCLAVSSDSQLVASGSADKSVKFWSPRFGNCLRSLRAHEESVMQVLFLPGTHYVATAGRDRELKLWDGDTYDLITILRGHGSEILALALSRDAAFMVSSGSDRQIRFWRRGGEQLFLSEERAKELEESFEQDAAREDLRQQQPSAEIVQLRPSRRTLESVRSTEQLMEILDRASAERADGVEDPCVRVVGHLNTLTSGNVYEVLLALPFRYAVQMLHLVCSFFEAVSSLSASDAAKSAAAHTKVLSAATVLETPSQVALITAYVHHQEFASTPSTRRLIHRVREHIRSLLSQERDRIGFAMAGVAYLQRSLKRSSGLRVAEVAKKPRSAERASR